MTRPRLSSAVALSAAAVVLAGCSAQAASAPLTTGTDRPVETSAPAASATAQAPDYGSAPVTTREMSPDGLLTDFYVDGQMATLRVPPTKGPTPMVVVVPGGGWLTSDPTDYQPLAQAMTANGMTSSLITYDTTTAGAQMPLIIDDVACAVRWSAFQLGALGYPPSEVIVAGHSAGGQLATEVALTGDRFGGDCPWPPVTVDRAVGIAGVYDLADAGTVLFPDGGTAEERAEYGPIATATDPNTAVPPALKVLLLSGSDDAIVPATQPEQFAAALRARGIDTTTDVLQLPHNMGIPLALEISPIILSWILGPAYTPPPTPTPTPPPAPVASAAPAASAVPVASAAPAASVAPPPASAAPAASPAASPPSG